MSRRRASLVCTYCARTFSDKEPLWRCLCGGLLDLQFDKPWQKDQFAVNVPGMWRYRNTLPLNDDANIVSFGEGATPLIAHDIDGDVLLKLDYLFPSGSFKDRGAAMLISKMKELGIRHAVEDSSGNAGAAIAAYCARAGIGCDIYAPSSTSAGKLRQIEAVGARLQKINGSREQVAEAALRAAEQSYYASHAWNPFFFHGVKTCAFEIFEQLGRAPETVFAPLGNGTLMLGLCLGFSELLTAGMIDHLPKMIAVQSANCAPLAEAFTRNLPAAVQVEKRDTLAEGIAVAQPVRGRQILRAVQESNGAILQVTEAEIASSLKALHSAGLYVEPTSAVAVAGYRQWRAERPLSPAVIVLTGHGLKSGKQPLQSPNLPRQQGL